jgi:sporulation protein YlmC with PRC-barrel domain
MKIFLRIRLSRCTKETPKQENRIMLRLFIATLFLLIALPVNAQADDLSASVQTVAEYNRIKPLQNPDYKQADDVLTRKLLDSKNRVIGEVQDIVITRNGSISSLKVEFDRLQLNAPVYLNYSALDIRPAGRGYIMRVRDGQIADLYPSLLAEVETAAGDENDLSVSRILGADIVSYDGRPIGIVEDVLFAADGGRAQTLYVTLTQGVLRGKGVAIPLKSAAFNNDNGQKMNAVISNELADAMISFGGQR